jgi:hypothetical protein
MVIYDSFGNEFWSILEMWERELDEETVQREKLYLEVFFKDGEKLEGHRIGSKKAWYRLVEDYWDKQETSV